MSRADAARERLPVGRGARVTLRCARLLPLVLATLCALSAVVRADPPAANARPVRVLVDGNSGPYRRAVAALKEARPGLRALSPTSPQAAQELQRDDVVWVGLGPKSAAQLASATSPRRAAALVEAKRKPSGVSTVALAPSMGDQLALLRQGFPGRTRFVVLKRKGSTQIDGDALQRAATAQHVSVEVLEVDAATDGVYVMERALRTDRARTLVWLLPDRGAVTSRTVPSLVRLALTSRVPLVGYSSVFLDAGAPGVLVNGYGAMALQALALAEAGTDAGLTAPQPELWINARLTLRLGIAARLGDGVKEAP